MEELILNNSYINWIEGLINKYGSIDDLFFVRNNKNDLSNFDKDNIYRLRDFYSEVLKFGKNGVADYALEYNGNNYVFSFDGECYSCRRCGDVRDVIHAVKKVIENYRK